MENLMAPDTKFLLDRNIEDLHHTSREWLSEINFWKTELAFFQKILEISAPKLQHSEEKMQLDHLQNLILFYNGELLDKYRQNVKRHAKHLGKILQNGSEEDALIRETHMKYYDQVSSFAKRFKEFKLELFEFFYAYT